MTPQDVLQEVQRLDKYARYNKHKGRRETWEETTNRVMKFFMSHVKSTRPEAFDRIPWDTLKASLLNREALPSMRVVQMAGPPLERCNVGAYNPVSGDTKVLTREYGTVAISELVDKPATVLNVAGRWARATFAHHGEQVVRLCHFRPARGNATTTDVRATDNHRWLLVDGTVKATTNLCTGDQIRFVAAKRSVNTEALDYILGLKHGLIYGDGTTTYKQERAAGYHVRLCADKDDLLPLFRDNKITYPPSFGGDPIVLLYDNFAKTHALKELPSTEESDEYLVGFVRGWFAADGHVSAAGQFSLCGDAREEAWFESVGRLGYIVQSSRPLPTETNFGTRKKKSLTINFFRASLTPEDFIVARKRQRFKPIQTTYTFIGFGPTTHANVYCAVVPDTNTFVLARGLVTGNCSYLPIDSINSFPELLYILMQGTGVGFSVETRYVDKLPRIKKQRNQPPIEHVILDTTEGWCDALKLGLESWFNGLDVRFVYDKIRPQGAPLKTKGGRASGPGPLKQLLDTVRNLILARQGLRLTPLDCHDIACLCGSIVQVGGVRRAAEISLSDLDDHEMRRAKVGPFWETAPHRAMANNSAVYEEKPPVDVFMEEWLSLMKSGTGERGIFNREGVIAHRPQRRKKAELGVNPCVPGETLVLTIDGYKPIATLVGQRVNVWTGDSWETVQPFSTGLNELVRVVLNDGTDLVCTPYHEFVLTGDIRKVAEELRPGDALEKFRMPVITVGTSFPVDAYSQGFFAGDGCEGLNHSWVYLPKAPCMERLVGTFGEYQPVNKRWTWKHGAMYSRDFVPINGDLVYRLNWLAGLLDSDGTVTRDKHGNGFQVVSINLPFLQQVRLMLTTLGVQAKICKAHDAGWRQMPDGAGGHQDYWCKPSWRLLIGNSDAYALIERGLKLNRLVHCGTPPQRDARRFVRVERVEDLGYAQETYCFTAHDSHRGTFNGIVTGQCGEIMLRPREFCNLSIAVARPQDTLESLRAKVKLATIWGTLQATLTNFNCIGEEWKRNCEEEALLGVDITGQLDCPLFLGGDASNVLRDCKYEVLETNAHYAEVLGINKAAAATCIKPSGNSSQLLDCASGLHPRYAKFYIRRLRIGAHTPIGQWLRTQGVRWSPEVGQGLDNMTVMVVDFPVKAPEGAKTRHDMTALQQLEYWLMVKRNFVEHGASVTIYVGPDEWLEVGAWVYRNWDNIAGLSFLPKDGGIYQLAPYQEITEADYNELVKGFPEVDFGALESFESGDQTTVNSEFACMGGQCDV